MYDKLNLDTHDRSISSLRTLRMPEDEDIFWFRDDLHQPYPICPLGMTTIQKHHAWGYHVGAEVTKLPPSKGGHVKIYKGRAMLGFEALTDADEIAKRAAEFTKLLEYCRPNWDTFYNGYIDEVKQGLSFMASVTDGFSDTDLHQALRRAEAINRRNWEIHFILMYVADMLYFGFEAFCKEHGLAEKEFTVMLKGLDTMATATDAGLWELARLADAYGIADTILSRRQSRAHPSGKAAPGHHLDQRLHDLPRRLRTPDCRRPPGYHLPHLDRGPVPGYRYPENLYHESTLRLGYPHGPGGHDHRSPKSRQRLHGQTEPRRKNRLPGTARHRQEDLPVPGGPWFLHRRRLDRRPA